MTKVEFGNFLMCIRNESNVGNLNRIIAEANARILSIDKDIVTSKDEDSNYPKWIQNNLVYKASYSSLLQEMRKEGVDFFPTEVNRKDVEREISTLYRLADSIAIRSVVRTTKERVLEALNNLCVVRTKISFLNRGDAVPTNINIYILRFKYVEGFLEKAYPGYMRNGMITIPLLGIAI